MPQAVSGSYLNMTIGFREYVPPKSRRTKSAGDSSVGRAADW